jgi:hypothetical protein
MICHPTPAPWLKAASHERGTVAPFFEWPLGRDPRFSGCGGLCRRHQSSGENPKRIDPGENLICLERIAALKGVADFGGRMVILAGTTFSQLLDEPIIAKHLPVLAHAIASIGSPMIRNMGTIGGNICTASPAGDPLAPLYALGTKVELASETGVRSLPLGRFPWND